MVQFIIRLVINGIAIWAASRIVDGVTLEGTFLQILVVVVIFALVNAILKPLFKLLTLPLVLLTLGLFTLVINAFLLWFVSILSPALTVELIMPAFWGALVISLVSWLLSMFLGDD